VLFTNWNATRDLSYIGQTGQRLVLRFKEHIRYITSNNPQSEYLLHIAHNIQEYEPMETTMTQLDPAHKKKQTNEYFGKLLYSILQPTQHEYYGTNLKIKKPLSELTYNIKLHHASAWFPTTRPPPDTWF
jgi:hypothetical protein